MYKEIYFISFYNYEVQCAYSRTRKRNENANTVLQKKKKKITLRRLPDKRFKKSTYKYLMNTLRSV